MKRRVLVACVVLRTLAPTPTRAAERFDPARNADLVLATKMLKSEALANDVACKTLDDVLAEFQACAEEVRGWTQAVEDASVAHRRWLAAFEAQTVTFLGDTTPIDSWAALSAFQQRTLSLEQQLPDQAPLRMQTSRLLVRLAAYGNRSARAVAATETLLQSAVDQVQRAGPLLERLRRTQVALRRTREEAANAHLLLIAELQTRSHLTGQLPALWSQRLSAATARLTQLGVAQGEQDLRQGISDLLTLGHFQSRILQHDLRGLLMHEALLSPLSALRLEYQRRVELEDLDDELDAMDLSPDLAARLNLLMGGAYQAHRVNMAALLAAKAEAATYRQRRLAEIHAVRRRADAKGDVCDRLAEAVSTAHDIASEEAYREYVNACVANS